MTDPEFGWGKSCDDYVKPAALLGPHAAPLGMRFYTGTMFPAQYRGAIFIARHGPWNRTKKYADVSVAYVDAQNKVTRVEPFLQGFVKDNAYLGRPVDVLVCPTARCWCRTTTPAPSTASRMASRRSRTHVEAARRRRARLAAACRPRLLPRAQAARAAPLQDKIENASPVTARPAHPRTPTSPTSAASPSCS